MRNTISAFITKVRFYFSYFYYLQCVSSRFKNLSFFLKCSKFFICHLFRIKREITISPVFSITLFFPLFLLLFNCQKKEHPSYEETFTVKTVDLRDILSQSGEVKPVFKIDLKSEASGKIERVFVKEGQRITKGDTILLIDPARLITQKKKLELLIREAEIEFTKSQREYIDGKELQSNGSLSYKKLFDLEIKNQLDSINLKRQLLDLVDIQDQLRETIIISPMTGVITKLSIEEGEIAVSATSGYQNGTEIATIADITKLEVITSIGEVDYINIKSGQTVKLKPEAIDNSYTRGTINFISLSAKKDDKNELAGFEVRVTIDSIIPGIAPGINVTVDFIIREKPNVLGIPFHFIEKDDSVHYAYKIVKNSSGVQSTQKIPIKVGETDYRFYEVISGLNAGDLIALVTK